MHSHTVERWVRSILAIVSSDADVRDLAHWSKRAGVSVGSIRGLCAVLGVRAKDALDFARVLRVIAATRVSGRWQPNVLIDVADIRTLYRLFHRGAVGDILAGRRAPDLDEFVRTQRFIREPACVDAILGRIEQITMAASGGPAQEPRNTWT